MDIGVCGDNCLDCPRYSATRTNNTELFSELLHLYIKAGLRPKDTKVEELRCEGCETVKTCAYPGLKACTNEYLVENCGECQRYPCARIEAVFKKSEATKNTMKMALTSCEMGLFGDAFFRKEENLNRIHQRMFPA